MLASLPRTRGVVPAARRPRRAAHRQRPQPRVRLRTRRAAASARRAALDDQRQGAPAGDVPRRRGDPASAVPRLAGRPSGAARRTASTPQRRHGRDRQRGARAATCTRSPSTPRATRSGHLGDVPGRLPDAVKEPAARRCATWVTPAAARELTSPLAERLLEESQRWRQRGRDPRPPDRRDRGGASPSSSSAPSCPSPPTTTSTPTATPRRRCGWRKRQRADLQGEHWIARAGAARASCPTTRSSTTRSPSTSACPGSTRTPASTRPRPVATSRNAALALREFAPGATFYAGGHQVKVDAVDLGDSGEAVRTLGVLPGLRLRRRRHGRAPRRRRARAAAAPAIADVDQRLDVVELTQRLVHDAARRGRDRRRARRADPRALRPGRHSPTSTRPSVTEPVVRRGLRLRRQARQGPGDPVAQPRPGRGPRLRPASSAGRRSTPSCSGSAPSADSSTAAPAATRKYEHRPWCSLRNAPEEDTRRIALSAHASDRGAARSGCRRWSPSGAPSRCPSLAAAVKLGLREHIGGAPDHLALEVVVDPTTDEPELNADALLLHDLVPGGTGYLAELARRRTAAGDPAAGLRGRARLQLRRRRRGWPATGACCRSPGPGRTVTSRGSRRERLLQRDPARRRPDRRRSPTRTPVVGGHRGRGPADFDPESKMEQKFRAVLRERLRALGRHVKEHPGQARQPAGDHRRRRPHVALDPQVNVARSKPDFVLRCDDPNVPRMAIFCDGWRYHASAQHNRLADDAASAPTCATTGSSCSGLSWPTWTTSASAARLRGSTEPRCGRRDGARRPRPEARPLRPGRRRTLDLLVALGPGARPGRPAGHRRRAAVRPAPPARQQRGSTGQRSDLLGHRRGAARRSSPRASRATRPRGPGATTPWSCSRRLNPKNKSHRGRRRPGRPTPRPSARTTRLRGRPGCGSATSRPAQHRDDHHRPEPASPAAAPPQHGGRPRRRRTRSTSPWQPSARPGRRRAERDFLVALSATRRCRCRTRGRGRRPAARAALARSQGHGRPGPHRRRAASCSSTWAGRSSTWTSTRSTAALAGGTA